jgi:hypothetical protein
MRLADLNACFSPEGAETVAAADAVWFDCPGCVGTERQHRLRMPFASKHPTGTAWTEQGTTLEDLTFVDAPRGSRSLRVTGYPCHSHFNVTGGAIDFYPDSHSP